MQHFVNELKKSTRPFKSIIFKINRKRKVCGIFFVISKAFDKVWHAGLIYKLIYLEVPIYIIRFIKNFLSGRFFKVKVNDTCIKLHPITCSVPQGSVLGALLFLVFIGDIPLSNNKNVSYSALFADDLSTIFFFKKPGSITRIMKVYLENLVDWLFKWRLKMNASKFCYTISLRAGIGNVKLDLRLNGESIPYTNYFYIFIFGYKFSIISIFVLPFYIVLIIASFFKNYDCAKTVL